MQRLSQHTMIEKIINSRSTQFPPEKKKNKKHMEERKVRSKDTLFLFDALPNAFRVVCGAANNQLRDPKDDGKLGTTLTRQRT